MLKAKKHNYLRDYFADAWNTMDWLTIAFGLIIGVIWFDMVNLQNDLATKVSVLPDTPNQVGS